MSKSKGKKSTPANGKTSKSKKTQPLVAKPTPSLNTKTNHCLCCSHSTVETDDTKSNQKDAEKPCGNHLFACDGCKQNTCPGGVKPIVARARHAILKDREQTNDSLLCVDYLPLPKGFKYIQCHIMGYRKIEGTIGHRLVPTTASRKMMDEYVSAQQVAEETRK